MVSPSGFDQSMGRVPVEHDLSPSSPHISFERGACVFGVWRVHLAAPDGGAQHGHPLAWCQGTSPVREEARVVDARTVFLATDESLVESVESLGSSGDMSQSLISDLTPNGEFTATWT